MGNGGIIMATATFVKTSLVDTTDQTKSQAIVEVDGVETTVDFWLSLIDVWGKEDTKLYLCAEALWQTGNYVDAHNLLKTVATGKITVDADGKVTSDTRTWQKRWIDEHSLPIPVEVDFDPLQ
jgi:hypothetical protein